MPENHLTEIREKLSTDDGMIRFLDNLFGVGAWVYDTTEDVWVAVNKRHTGPGRGFTVVQRGGDWFDVVLPDAIT